MELRVHFFLFSFLFLILFILIPHYGSAQAAPCLATGSRLAVGDELKRAEKMGIRIPGNCIDQQTAAWLDAKIDEDVAFFHSNNRICGGRKAGLPADFNPSDTSPTNWNRIREDNGFVYFVAPTNAMNPGAMRCFRRFFEEVEKMNNPTLKPCVSSALRSMAHQRASCFAPNSTVCGRGRGSGPRSCPNDLQSYASCPHVNGLAMDLGNRGGEVQAILALARRFNGFSRVGVGKADPWHVEARGCAGPNFRPSLDAKDTWNPDARTNTPTDDVASLIRRSLGLTPQPPQLPPQLPPLSQQQSPLGAFTQPAALAPQAAAPAQTSQSQSQGQTGAVTTGSTNTNTNTNSNTNSSVTSVVDQLKELANPKPTATSDLAKTVTVVITGDEAKTIASTDEKKSGQTGQQTHVGSLSAGQETFTSAAQGAQGPNTTFTPAQSALQQTLTTLKTALYLLLDYLKPFGIRAALSPAVLEGE